MNARMLSIARFAKMCYRDGMPTELEALAEQVAELLVRRRKTKPRQRNRKTLHFRVTDEELTIIDAAAIERGVSLSDFCRLALNEVLTTVLPIERKIPHGFDRMRIHRKAAHFDDGKTDGARNAAERIRSLNLEAQSLRIAADDALASRSTGGQGMLAQPRPTKFPR